MEGELISVQARNNPDKPAVIMGGSGQITTFAQFEARTNQIAHLCRSLGLKTGDRIAFCMENRTELLEVAWGGMRAGLLIVPVSSKLTATEIEYIVRDSNATVLVTSPGIGDAFADLPAKIKDVTLFSIGPAHPGFRSWDAECAAMPATPIDDQSLGGQMFYSSGTTGRPKGIRWAEAEQDGPVSVTGGLDMFGLNESTVFLCPAPLYHSAPYMWAMGVVRGGGTTIIMEKFDAERALALIDTYRVNVTHWVPTHFIRMLKLPDDVRGRYDISSVKLVAHSAAPCPVPVKQAMIEWFGPIVVEYFGSTEQAAMTFITAQEWLERPGSVGKCYVGTIHICDDEGEPLPTGAIGAIYSENGKKFTYHNDPGKTADALNRHGWTSVGDVGYMDEDGYIFLTDRKGFMIITGGVNVYPQEIENLLVTHPRIYDAAVIGTPDPEMGEMVTAVIQPVDMADATPEFAGELRVWMRQSLSGVKVPKRIEFLDDLPRLPTGKMQKFALRERYS